jgi:predicted  nucleic acid-binding Zn-ribbon protein
MADHLSEHTDDDFSSRTVRRALKGLSGQKQGLPKKYHTEERYLKKIPEHPDNAINYALTDDGRAVVRGSDVPLNLSVVSSSSSLGGGFGESGKQGGVRPHKCWSRELVRRRDGSAAGGLSWGDRRAVLAEKDIGWEEVSKELPHREQSEVGELVHYGRVRLILFENSVLVRFSLPESEDGIFEVLDDWWEARQSAVDWLESVFPVSVRSTPLDVSMPLSTQEWGDVRNEFAEWIASNPEFQDDSPNSLLEVKNDRGERVFHIDTSPEDDLGNDLAEGEFPHSQFGAGHITNMKQAVKWLATLGVKPQDFTAAQWTRRNHDELEKLVEFDAEELEEKVGEVEDSVDGLQTDVDSLESQVTRLEGKVDGVSEGLQQNRERISDVEERVDSTVRRVDATREEFHGFRDDLREEVENVEKEVRSVEKWFSDEVSDTQELVQRRVGGVEDEVEDLQEDVKMVNGSVADLALTLEERGRRIDSRLEKILEEQQKTLVDRVRDELGALAEAGKSAGASIRSKFGTARKFLSPRS